MKPSLVVLTDFSPAAERARAYAAALAGPLGAELHLVHVVAPLPPIPTESGVLLMPPTNARYVQETRQSLAQVAAGLPVSATAELLETTWDTAIEQAIKQYRPQLIVAGLTATHGWLDEWLSNRTRPLAHQTGCPLLLVPELLPTTALHPPKRIALAVEDQNFQLSPAAVSLAPLLDTLAADLITVCVLPHEERAGGWEGLRAVQHCGLGNAAIRSGLHKVDSTLPASGILQGVRELQADMLALLDQGHGWLHQVFVGSVIGYVLRHTPVPVLLLPAESVAPVD
jgi:nucleotide-binding universal stress UspA family protein